MPLYASAAPSLEAAAAALTKIYTKDTGTLGWQAAAWLARCQQQLGNPNDARKTLSNILSVSSVQANAAALADARRLARYFVMLLTKENPEGAERDPVGVNIAAGRAWLKGLSASA